MRWSRKSRAGEWGPWHRKVNGLTLCGRRLPGLTHDRESDPPADERRCEDCLRHEANGTRAAYRSR